MSSVHGQAPTCTPWKTTESPISEVSYAHSQIKPQIPAPPSKQAGNKKASTCMHFVSFIPLTGSINKQHALRIRGSTGGHQRGVTEKERVTRVPRGQAVQAWKGIAPRTQRATQRWAQQALHARWVARRMREPRRKPAPPCPPPSDRG